MKSVLVIRGVVALDWFLSISRFERYATTVAAFIRPLDQTNPLSMNPDFLAGAVLLWRNITEAPYQRIPGLSAQHDAYDGAADYRRHARACDRLNVSSCHTRHS
jgi:hypothetical protein